MLCLPNAFNTYTVVVSYLSVPDPLDHHYVTNIYTMDVKISNTVSPLMNLRW